MNARHSETAGTNIATRGGEDDGYRNTTVHVNTGYTGERGSVVLVARQVTAQSEYDPTPFPDFVPVDGNLELNVRQRLLGVTATIDSASGLTNCVSFKRYESRNDNLTDGVHDGSSDGDKDQLTYQGDYAFNIGPTTDRLTWAYEYAREGFNQRGAPSSFGDPNQDQHMDRTAPPANSSSTGAAVTSLSARHDWNSDFDDSNDYRVAVRVPVVSSGTTLYRQRRHRHEGSDVRRTLRLHAEYLHR